MILDQTAPKLSEIRAETSDEVNFWICSSLLWMYVCVKHQKDFISDFGVAYYDRKSIPTLISPSYKSHPNRITTTNEIVCTWIGAVCARDATRLVPKNPINQPHKVIVSGKTTFYHPQTCANQSIYTAGLFVCGFLSLPVRYKEER